MRSPTLLSLNHTTRAGVVLAYLNGQFLPRSEATISVDDRGFVFGDGVYEVWRVVNGRLFELERHLERLVFGLGELRIPAPPLVDPDVFLSAATRLIAGSGLSDGEATVYVEITRGVSPRAHQFPAASVKPTVYATVNRLTPPEEARARGAAAITIPDIRWSRCDLKTLQLLPNVLAKQAAVEAGAMDALMVRDGMVTEGSHTNVFGVVDGALRTHPANNFILPGITRTVVLEIAHELGIPVAEQAFAERELSSLEELFLAGTTTDVMPIVRVNGKDIGDGKPGPVAKRLFDGLRGRLDAVGAGPVASLSTST